MNKNQNTIKGLLSSGVPTRDTVVILLAGLMVSTGLPPFQWTGVLVPVGLAIFFYQLLVAPNPGAIAWQFGLAHQTSLLYWLFLLVPAKTIPSPVLVYVQAIAAILYVSVFYMGFGSLVGKVKKTWGLQTGLLLTPVLWTIMEALRAQGEMGFPWCLSGSAVIGTPLMSLAAASGEIGLGTALAFTAALAAAAFLARSANSLPRSALITLAAATICVWGGLFWGSILKPETTLPADSLTQQSANLRTSALPVAAVQADVDLEDKWNHAKLDSTRVPYATLTKKAATSGAELIIWAETAMPAYLLYDVQLLNWVRHQVQEENVHLYTGFPDATRQSDGTTDKFNSSGLFSPDGRLIGKYAKYHLLPIGETMPFQSVFPFLGKVDVGQAEWIPGQPPMPMVMKTPEGDFRFSGLICFESAFASLARYSVRHGSQCIVVITNDGWFGKTAGPRQHTALARLRAVECGVPVIRSANNGISFICDADGEILDLLDLGKRGIVSADIVPGDGHTSYVRYGAWPLLWFLVAWSLFIIIKKIGADGFTSLAGKKGK